MGEAPYRIAGRETLAETAELRMGTRTLGSGETVPWHWHSEAPETVFCMEGPIVVEMRAPSERIELTPGQLYRVPAKRAHRILAKDGGGAKFALLHGVGAYDFRPVGG